jgi:hypothetical protein
MVRGCEGPVCPIVAARWRRFAAYQWEHGECFCRRALDRADDRARRRREAERIVAWVVALLDGQRAGVR